MKNRDLEYHEQKSRVAMVLIAIIAFLLLITVYTMQSGLFVFIVVCSLFITVILHISADLQRHSRSVCRYQMHELERAKYDFLTNFYNRGTTQVLIEHYVSQDMPSALLVFDIDNFKMVNDRLGHISGDLLLQEITAELRSVFRESDILGRVGGDEFAILMPGVTDRQIVQKKAEQVLEICTRNVKTDVGMCGVSCSIGIAFAPQCGRTYAQLFDCADRALYRSKNEGKCRISFCEDIK